MEVNIHVSHWNYGNCLAAHSKLSQSRRPKDTHAEFEAAPYLMNLWSCYENSEDVHLNGTLYMQKCSKFKVITGHLLSHVQNLCLLHISHVPI